MPVASNVTLSGTNECGAGFGDYISGGANGRWQGWTSVPYIVTGPLATADFSAYGSYLIELVAGQATTVLLSNIPVGQPVRIITLQSASGTPGTVAWAGPTLRWSGGTVGQATQTNGAYDVFVFFSPESGVVAGGIAMPAI